LKKSLPYIVAACAFYGILALIPNLRDLQTGAVVRVIFYDYIVALGLFMATEQLSKPRIKIVKEVKPKLEEHTEL
jgi:hypothetical protein